MTLPLVVTQAGYARFTAAQLGDPIDLSVSAVGFTDAAFVAAPTLTALPGEHRRVSTLSGEKVGDNIVHMVVRDSDPVGYRVRGFGLYLGDGTLFATYAQPDPIVEKSSVNDLHFAIDIAFPTANIRDLSFGDTNFLLPPGTTERRGLLELATQAEIDAGTDTARAVTPLGLATRIAGALAGLSDTLTAAIEAVRSAFLTRRIDTDGLALGGGTLATDRTISVPAASAAQLLFATAGNVAVTPAAIGALARSLDGPDGYWTFPGGLIVQWVNYRNVITNEAVLDVAWPVAFTTRCLIALPMIYAGDTVSGRDVAMQLAGEPTTAGCRIKMQVAPDAPLDRAGGYIILALGY